MRLPDIPVREGIPFAKAAETAGIDPIFIAPPHASEATLEGVAAHSRGYIYAVSRLGVTGTERESSTDGLRDVVENLARFGGAPILLGFGISTPDHVAAAIKAGASGTISGSAITKIIESHREDNNAMLRELDRFVSDMKAATRR